MAKTTKPKTFTAAEHNQAKNVALVLGFGLGLVLGAVFASVKESDDG